MKKEYLTYMEKVSLSTTIDGVSTFIDSEVMCDDGENVSITYWHPFQQSELITKVVPRTQILPRRSIIGNWYGGAECLS